MTPNISDFYSAHLKWKYRLNLFTHDLRHPFWGYFPIAHVPKKFWPFSFKPHCLKREGFTFQIGKNIVSHQRNIWKGCSWKWVMTSLSTRKLQRKTTARNLRPPLTFPRGASFPRLCSFQPPGSLGPICGHDQTHQHLVPEVQNWTQSQYHKSQSKVPSNGNVCIHVI